MKTNNETCEVAKHSSKRPHFPSDFTFQCIAQIQNDTNQDTKNLLITKEAYWSVQLF